MVSHRGKGSLIFDENTRLMFLGFYSGFGLSIGESSSQEARFFKLLNDHHSFPSDIGVEQRRHLQSASGEWR
jgi:hypothetical protein